MSSDSQARRPGGAFKTDVVRRTQLDVGAASLRQSSSSSQVTRIEDSKEHLQRITEDFNRRVDGEIETLANGMLDLTRLAEIKNKDQYKAAHDAWQSKSRAEAMVKSAESLLAISHALKILFILKDDEPSSNESKRQQIQKLESYLNEQKDESLKLVDEYIQNLNSKQSFS